MLKSGLKMEGVTPDFHKHYNADLSEKKATAMWQKDIETYENIMKAKGSGVNTASCSHFKYTVSTYTGTGSNQGTNGKVLAHHIFNVDGSFKNQTVTSNNSGNDREGGWDFYFITKNASSIYAVKLTRMHLALKGTDAWFIKHWKVTMYDTQQTCSSFSNSKGIYNNVNTWLDSPTSSDWNQIYKIPSNSGLLQFF
jgi:hypothetical protein